MNSPVIDSSPISNAMVNAEAIKGQANDYVRNMQTNDRHRREQMQHEADMAALKYSNSGGSGKTSSAIPEDVALKAEKATQELEELKKSKANRDAFVFNQELNKIASRQWDKYSSDKLLNIINTSDAGQQVRQAIEQTIGKQGNYTKLIDYNDTLDNVVRKLMQVDTDIARKILGCLSAMTDAFNNSPALIKVNPTKISLQKALNYLGGNNRLMESLEATPEFREGIVYLKMMEQLQSKGELDLDALKTEKINGKSIIEYTLDPYIGGMSQEHNDRMNSIDNDSKMFTDGFNEGRQAIKDKMKEEEDKIKGSWGNEGFIENEDGTLVERKFTEADESDAYKQLKKDLEDYEAWGNETLSNYSNYKDELDAAHKNSLDAIIDIAVSSIANSADMKDTMLQAFTMFGGLDNKGTWNGTSIYNQLNVAYRNPIDQEKYDRMAMEQSIEDNNRIQRLIESRTNIKVASINEINAQAQLNRAPELFTISADTAVNQARYNNLESSTGLIQSDTKNTTARSRNLLSEEYQKALLAGDKEKALEIEKQMKALERMDAAAGGPGNPQSTGMIARETPMSQSISSPAVMGATSTNPNIKPQDQSGDYTARDSKFKDLSQPTTLDELADKVNHIVSNLDGDKITDQAIARVDQQTTEWLNALAGTNYSTGEWRNDENLLNSNPALKSLANRLNDLNKLSMQSQKQGEQLGILQQVNGHLDTFLDSVAAGTLPDTLLGSLSDEFKSLAYRYANLGTRNEVRANLETLNNELGKIAVNILKGNPAAAYEPLKQVNNVINKLTALGFTENQVYTLMEQLSSAANTIYKSMVVSDSQKQLPAKEINAINNKVAGIRAIRAFRSRGYNSNISPIPYGGDLVNITYRNGNTIMGAYEVKTGKFREINVDRGDGGNMAASVMDYIAKNYNKEFKQLVANRQALKKKHEEPGIVSSVGTAVVNGISGAVDTVRGFFK